MLVSSLKQVSAESLTCDPREIAADGGDGTQQRTADNDDNNYDDRRHLSCSCNYYTVVVVEVSSLQSEAL